MGEINLKPEKHHSKHKIALERYDQLIGLEKQKQELLSHLELIMNPKSLDSWHKEHHGSNLELIKRGLRIPHLVILSGDVGCGKSELAGCVGSKLSELLNDDEVMVYHSPSNLRGSDKVGGISSRIGSLFEQVRLDKKNKYHILIIDEADDVVNSRDQNHQHLEDRSGVNAIIKEIDALEKAQTRIAVILISNRSNIFDPAVSRRSAKEIKFDRPQKDQIEKLLEIVLGGLEVSKYDFMKLVTICEAKNPLFTYSDFFNRIGIQNILNARNEDRALNYVDFLNSVNFLEPSPQFKENERK